MMGVVPHTRLMTADAGEMAIEFIHSKIACFHDISSQLHDLFFGCWIILYNIRYGGFHK